MSMQLYNHLINEWVLLKSEINDPETSEKEGWNLFLYYILELFQAFLYGITGDLCFLNSGQIQYLEEEHLL